MYGFTTHYTLFVIILGLMLLTGGFTKNPPDEVVIFAGAPVTDCACPVSMDIWMRSYILLCPIYLFISIYAQKWAKDNNNLYTYHIERYRVLFKIRTNPNMKVNRILLFIDTTSFLWTMFGTIIINAVPSQSGANALMDCLRDYGVNTCLMMFVFLLMGWV